RRLVEEEDARTVDQRECEVEPPLHAARVAAHLAIRGVREADALEQLVPARCALLPRQRLQARLKTEVLAAGEERVEGGLLEGCAARLAHLRSVLRDVEAGNTGGPRRWWQQRGQHQHRGRLAGAVRSEEAVDLAGRDVEVDPVDGARALLELA